MSPLKITVEQCLHTNLILLCMQLYHYLTHATTCFFYL